MLTCTMLLSRLDDFIIGINQDLSKHYYYVQNG